MPDFGDLPKPSGMEVTGAQTVSYQELHRILREIPSKFTPTTERPFTQIVGREFEEMERVDLTQVSSGTVIKVAGGVHLGANYTLEVIDSPQGEKLVYIWRSGYCLEGQATEIVTHEPIGNGYRIEKGVLQVGKAMHFPYFTIKDGKVEKPRTTWMDTCVSLNASTQK